MIEKEPWWEWLAFWALPEVVAGIALGGLVWSYGPKVAKAAVKLWSFIRR